MRVRNKSIYVNENGFQRASNNFYTGDDAEIKARKDVEWYTRVYWEAVRTFDQNGYVIFDTFTMDDDHISRLRDFFDASVLTDKDGNYYGDVFCFDRGAFDTFIHAVRDKLDRLGFDRTKFKYLFTTEYGHDWLYRDRQGRVRRGTNRPHYHAMFFVTDPQLTPVVLNAIIGEFWTHGWHDNGKDNFRLRRNLFDFRLNPIDRDVRIRGLANYVGKYMHKDAEYSKLIESRINAISYNLVDEGFWHGDPDGRRAAFRQVRKGVSRIVGTFHGQSQHFGEEWINHSDIVEVVRTGCMKMPDTEKNVKMVPLSTYFKRKLFYHQVKRDDGGLVWVLNDDPLARVYYRNSLARQEKVMADIFFDAYRGLGFDDRLAVDIRLDGRTFKDLAEYYVYFKERLFSCDLSDITKDDVVDIMLSQDFTCREGNELNSLLPTMHRITQFDDERFRSFDDILFILDDALEARHNNFNDTYDRRRELEKFYECA